MSGIVSAQFRRVGLFFGFIFLVLALWCFPGVSFAQEWATNGNNIYNTNTENVGIGITNPSNKLEVSSPFTRLKVKGTASDAWVWADGAGINNSGFMAGTDGTTRSMSIPSVSITPVRMTSAGSIKSRSPTLQAPLPRPGFIREMTLPWM